VQFTGLPLQSVAGRLRRIQAFIRSGELEHLLLDSDGPVDVVPARYQPLVRSTALLTA
jgi:hypothetical protein